MESEFRDKTGESEFRLHAPHLSRCLVRLMGSRENDADLEPGRRREQVRLKRKGKNAGRDFRADDNE